MQKKEGFFRTIAKLIFAHSDPQALKKRELKKIAKEISRKKFKWYKPSTGELLPQMGRFFYEIYATVGAAQGLLSKVKSSDALKMIVIEEYLSDAQVKIKEGLSEERLKERAEKEDASSLGSQVARELQDFQREFTPEKIKNIDHIYSQIEEFINFVTFDYYFLLKKFDPQIPEHNFSYEPKCNPIHGEYILEELKDFAAIAYGLPLNADWKAIFAMIKHYKGVEPASISRWTKLVRAIGDIRQSNILPLIIRHIANDPLEQVRPITASARIVDSFISKIHSHTESLLTKIVQEAKASTVSQLAVKLFGDALPSCLENYTSEASERFKLKGFTGFTRVDELNCLAAFLFSCLKADIAEIVDLCLVRGQWIVPEDSATFSNSYHTLLELSAKIKEFDSSLAEVTPLGTKLNSLLTRQEHDLEARDQLKTNLKDVNREAISMLTESARHLVVIGRTLKMLIDDYGSQPHTTLSNWHEIEGADGKNLPKILSGGYKKIYSIITLLQVYIKGEQGRQAELNACLGL